MRGFGGLWDLWGCIGTYQGLLAPIRESLGFYRGVPGLTRAFWHLMGLLGTRAGLSAPTGTYQHLWAPMVANGHLRDLWVQWGPMGESRDALAFLLTFGDPLAPMGTSGGPW